MLDLNPGLIIWTIVTFLVAMLILRRYAWKPLLGALAAREEKIRSQLEQAEHAQAEAQRLLEEHQRALAAAEEQSQRIIRGIGFVASDPTFGADQLDGAGWLALSRSSASPACRGVASGAAEGSVWTRHGRFRRIRFTSPEQQCSETRSNTSIDKESGHEHSFHRRRERAFHGLRHARLAERFTGGHGSAVSHFTRLR